MDIRAAKLAAAYSPQGSSRVRSHLTRKALVTRTSRLIDRFPTTPVAKHVGTQLMRSATSPFANYGEAQAAESRQDFLHKLKVCLKELRETQAWLKFAGRMNLCTENSEAARRECDELVAIFVASIKTATSKM